MASKNFLDVGITYLTLNFRSLSSSKIRIGEFLTCVPKQFDRFLRAEGETQYMIDKPRLSTICMQDSVNMRSKKARQSFPLRRGFANVSVPLLPSG